MEGTEVKSLAAEVSELDWYHTLELAPGVVTPGWFDLRGIAPRVPFPPLEGKRCLDVATFNGFWAFEMERRGAREVVGIDVLDPQQWDWPPDSDPRTVAVMAERQAHGRGFQLAREALGSSVTRLDLSVYDLDPDEHGEFEVAYVGSLLMHLRDPIGALERVRSVCRETLVVVDNIALATTLLHRRRPVAHLDARGRPWWWKPNLAALALIVESAGFELARKPERVFMTPGPGHPPRRFRPLALLNPAGRDEMLRAWRGDPHGLLVARPSG